MRKATNLLIAAVALSALALASPAFAAHFWTDSFTYSDGSLPTVSGGLWVRHNGTTLLDPQVISGVAQVNMTQAPDDSRSFTPRANGDKTYACFRFMLPDPQGAPSSGYFAHFKDAGTFNFVARTFVQPMSPAYTLGISSYNGAVTNWPSVLNYGQWYTVIISWDGSTTLAEMWIDPVNESSPKVTAIHTASLAFALQGFALRQFSGNWLGWVDDVGVGTTFDEACYDVVPTQPTTWGQLKANYR
jgi:hypothetical protein